MKKSIAIAVVLVSGLLLLGWASGLIGFHYPVVIHSEHLRNPFSVSHVVGNRIHLKDGRVIAVDLTPDQPLNNQLWQSSYQIDLEQHGDLVSVYAIQDGWVCGTPWAQPIRIPLIADRIYKNRRKLIALGRFEKTESQ